jgi:hypothetical protein
MPVVVLGVVVVVVPGGFIGRVSIVTVALPCWVVVVVVWLRLLGFEAKFGRFGYAMVLSCSWPLRVIG